MQDAPQEFAGYRRADTLAASYRATSQFTLWIGIALVTLGLLGIFLVGGLWGERVGIAVAILGASVLAWFVYRTNFKSHRIACPECAQTMIVLDTPVLTDQLSPPFDHLTQSLHVVAEHSFEGTDGYIYRIQHGGDSSVSFYRLLRRWYACPLCQICFLAEPQIQEHFESVHRSKAMRFKESLVVRADDTEVRETLKRLSEDQKNA